MFRHMLKLALLLGVVSAHAQDRAFTIQGSMPLPDGYSVSIVCRTDTAYSTVLAEGVTRRGQFLLTGKIDKPYQGTLMTNNLALVEQHQWPVDSIHWTYTEVFLSPGHLRFGRSAQAPTDAPLETSLALTGTQVQADWADLCNQGGPREADPWAFIASHPRSVVSVWLACGLLERAYNLTASQVEFLATTVQGSPDDPQRFQQFGRQLAAARKTVKGAPLTDLEMVDTNNTPCHLTSVVPRHGKYVLIDFWASWCGICLHAMPDVAQLADEFKDIFEVIAVSIDTKPDAWHKAMQKHPHPWPQYCLSKQGYQDLFDKYQVGNGVPYYLLLAPDGTVCNSPSGPEDVRSFLEQIKLAGGAHAQEGYTIEGTAEGTVEGDTVYLCEMQGFFSMIPLDSTYVKDSRFLFKGQQEGAALRFLLPIHQGQPVCMDMFVLENAPIKAKLKPQGQRGEWELGPSGRLYNQFLDGENVFSQQMEQPWQVTMDSTATEEARKAAQLTLDSLTNLQHAYQRQFIIDHAPSAVSDMLFGYCGQNLSEQQQEELLTLFGQQQPQYPVYKSIMAERRQKAATAVGATYTDISMADPDGHTISVSDYVGKNKYVLIDFWASWCGPCRAEMPTVVQAYTDYHAKGFEVIGVSLDNNRDAWLKAIGQLNMPWPQMSDLKGWNSEGAKLYNVKSIPANVLVDQQGTILAKDLRGDDLLQKLASLFQ